MSHIDHKRAAPTSISVILLTFSDTRDLSTDTTGQLLGDMLSEAGHVVVGYSIVQEDLELMRQALEVALERADAQLILCNGGTGIAARDLTPEVVRSLLDRELPGFGELFRYLSYIEIGPAGMLSRALGGVSKGKVLLALPGSRNACQLAMEKLILPEICHLVGEAIKGVPKGELSDDPGPRTNFRKEAVL